MDRNIDNTTVAWSADGKSHKDEDESAQAITVKAQMNANTIGWTKVLVDLPTGQQIANAGGLTTWTDDGTSTSNVPGLSTWLYCNLSENSAPYGYWTKTPHTRYTGGAWYVADGMNVSSVEGHVNFSSRPVITISKSDL